MDEAESLPLGVRRKIEGLCPRCGKPARDDADLCTDCTRQASAYTRDMRQRRRERGQCVDCGRRSPKRRCPRCFRRKGVSKPARGVEQANHVTDAQVGGKVLKVEVDSRYPDGRVRERFVGRGTRGAPSREQLEAEDLRSLRFARREIDKAIELLEQANATPIEMTRIQREAKRREALAPAGLAVRLVDEVLDRNKLAR